MEQCKKEEEKGEEEEGNISTVKADKDKEMYESKENDSNDDKCR
jgi:hypothetical protein